MPYLARSGGSTAHPLTEGGADPGAEAEVVGTRGGGRGRRDARYGRGRTRGLGHGHLRLRHLH